MSAPDKSTGVLIALYTLDKERLARCAKAAGISRSEWARKAFEEKELADQIKQRKVKSGPR